MTDNTQKNHQAIVDWAGDIVALVGHIEEALDHQLKLESNSAAGGALIRELHDTLRDDKKRAVAFQEQMGSTAGNPVVKTGSELLGKVAGLIDRMRKDSVAKALRDDYTAINHLLIAYTMLHTTSMALKDDTAMKFSEEGMRTCARLVQKINGAIPQAVVQDLMDNGDVDVVDANVVSGCRDTINSIWQEARAID